MKSQKRYNEWQRQRRKLTGNKSTHLYEKTVSGFLMRAYRNMKSRVTGIQKKKRHLYVGLEILPKEVFYEWSTNNAQFLKLFRAWVLNNYDKRLSPSVNRIDPRRGYTLDNIEWITHALNSSLASVTRYHKQTAIQAIYKAAGVTK